MTRTLLGKVERFRHLAMLLLVAFGFLTANAQLSSDEISEAILAEGSVPVTWTNDATHPWNIATDDDGSFMRTPETKEDSEFTSTLSFNYTSSYSTLLTFNTYRYHQKSGDILNIIIDGEQKGSTQSTYWYRSYNSFRFILPEGSHTVELVSVSVYSDPQSLGSGYYAGVRNLKICEFKELESSCLAPGSLPLTFVNDSKSPWLTETGYIRTLPDFSEETTPTISTTFTIDKPSMFKFDWRNSYGYDGVKLYVTIDGVPYNTYVGDSWTTQSVVLYPGPHTVEFQYWHNEYHTNMWTELRNVKLSQEWYEVTLNNPGELAVRLLQALEGKNLQDAELVKINGSMNSDDWSTVTQLTGIKAIDFSNTNITSIPNDGCRDLRLLSTVMLPETVTSIGNNAFRGTDFHQISIPASVENIGWNVWDGTPLQYVDFAEGSNLKKIGCYAFSETKIMEFKMPDSVTEFSRRGERDGYTPEEYYYEYYYEWDVVSNCKYLKKLHISDGLTIVPHGLAYQCTALEEVNIPKNATVIETYAFSRTNIKSISIPESVYKIGDEAFAQSALDTLVIPPSVTTFGSYFARECPNLKEITFSSHCWDMNRCLDGCTSLEKVVLPCSTPPSIYSDPFANINKSQVRLIVPDFALESYKADPYWYQFTNTQVSDEASIKDYWAIRGNLTLNDAHLMQGTPSVEMYEGGVLTLDENSTQTFDEFTYNTSESSPATVLSKSNTVSAGKLVSKFYVSSADKWFFFSPITDVRMSEVTYPSTDSWVIRYYDGARRATENAASGNWIDVPADSTLRSGQGYIIQARQPGWLNLPAAYTGEHSKFFGSNAVTMELEDNACETEANAGWNFVANPYPTYYDIYYIDMQAPITVWNGSTYRAYSLNDGDRGDDTFVLRPMQPFFVQKASADISTGMPLVGRQINTTIDRSRAPRPVVVDENRLKLNLELYSNDNEDADDYTRVVLNEKASLAYETVRDASKFMSMDANVAQLYTLGADQHPMAINERPYEDGNVALGVLLPATDRTYRITARRADCKAWLYDAETGMEFDLTEGDYIFNASKTGIDNTRFSIRFAPATSAVDGVAVNAVKVTGNVGSISVIAPAGATVAVFGTDGSIITDTRAENGNLEIPVAGGVYVVKVNGESVKTIVK